MSKKKLQTALSVYVNAEFGKIRAVLIDGKPYFIGKDVANALGYEKPLNALKRHVDEDDSLKRGLTDSLGRNQTTILINESGLYSLILSSKLESAKAFKRWVTSEVLPSIRETGTYGDKEYQKWLSMRQQTITTRKEETSAIKLFIEYARSQGFIGKDSEIYSRITVLTNLTAGLPLKKGRDGASISQLSIVDISENAYKQILIKGVADGLHYSRVLAQLEDWRTKFIDSAFIQSYIAR